MIIVIIGCGFAALGFVWVRSHVELSCLQTSRMYTVPLYEDLVAGVMKCIAVEIFYQTQRRMHPNLRRTLQQILFQTSLTNQNSPATPIVPTSSSTPPQQPPATTATSSPAANGTNAAIALRDVNVSA